MQTKQTEAFTLVERLVVVTIIALLVSILLPTLGRVRDAADRTVCMTNLSAIFKGWAFYGSENNRRPPILPGIDQTTADYRDNLKMGDECTASALGEGAQQNLCLLVKIGAVPWGMFICHAVESIQRTRGFLLVRAFDMRAASNGKPRGRTFGAACDKPFGVAHKAGNDERSFKKCVED